MGCRAAGQNGPHFATSRHGESGSQRKFPPIANADSAAKPDGMGRRRVAHLCGHHLAELLETRAHDLLGVRAVQATLAGITIDQRFVEVVEFLPGDLVAAAFEALYEAEACGIHEI